MAGFMAADGESLDRIHCCPYTDWVTKDAGFLHLIVGIGIVIVMILVGVYVIFVNHSQVRPADATPVPSAGLTTPSRATVPDDWLRFSNSPTGLFIPGLDFRYPHDWRYSTDGQGCRVYATITFPKGETGVFCPQRGPYSNPSETPQGFAARYREGKAYGTLLKEESLTVAGHKATSQEFRIQSSRGVEQIYISAYIGGVQDLETSAPNKKLPAGTVIAGIDGPVSQQKYLEQTLLMILASYTFR